jgi:hypothetical protein
MPEIRQLVGWNVGVERGRELDQATGETIPTWTLVYSELDIATGQPTGDQIRLGFREHVRDFIVQGLMSGILVAANGDLPKPE